MEHEIRQLRTLMETLEKLYSSVMSKDVDYGSGRLGSKSTLLKPGAEKIFALFKLTAITCTTQRAVDHEKGPSSFEVVYYAHDRKSGFAELRRSSMARSRHRREARA